MRVLYLLLMGLLMVSPAYGEDDCGLESRLEAGGAGQVTPGEANNVRDEAARSGVLLGQIEGGQPFGVLEGPRCGGGLTWWQVEYIDGGEIIKGWTVESTADSYFVEPLEGTFISWVDDEMSISFVLPTEIASDVEIAFVEREEPDPENPYSGAPAYAEILFSDDYADGNYYRPYDEPRIRVFVTSSFEGIEEGILGGLALGISTMLSNMIEEQTDLSTFSVITNDLPDFAPGAATSLLAFLDYADMANGNGIRFVTYYAQMLIGPTQEALLYRYMGVTYDEAYFINAELPVDAPRMPQPFNYPTDGSDGFDAFAVYAAEARVFFESFPMEEYNPNLTLLDTLVATMWIE